MNMGDKYISNKSVICVANCRNLAELIVDQLKFYDLSNRSISILYPDEERNGRKTHHFGYDHPNRTNDAMGPGRGEASAVGGTLAWIQGIAPWSVPGVGAFIAAGPIITCLNAAVAKSTGGGITGGMMGLGVSENQAKNYEARIRLGSIMICVHTDSPAEAMQAKFIFTRARAQDICITDMAFPEPEPETTGKPVPPRAATTFNTYVPDFVPHRGGLNAGLAKLK